MLFRPPAETSHYYRKESSTMARDTLERLCPSGCLSSSSRRASLLRRQCWTGLPWKHEPVTLSQSVPIVSLLKTVDLVICSGGTMLREAAYLGIPAYSIFKSDIGGVDRWLESIGRVKLIAGPEDLGRIELKPRGPISRLDSNPDLLEQLTARITAATAKQRTSRPRAWFDVRRFSGARSAP